MPSFTRYIGIDYSGAKTPTSSLKGLRVYLSDGQSSPSEVLPPPSPRKYWTRQGVAGWLEQQLRERVLTIVGIDHGFSFPVDYFDEHNLDHNWNLFLEDFRDHWPADEENTWIDSIRKGEVGKGALRYGNIKWRRVTEKRAGAAKSVFHFGVQGSVAKSTHAGLPWLLYLRKRLGKRLHFWPFDGWDIPKGSSAIVEVYPALWSHMFPRENRTQDQHDAFTIAEWLRREDNSDTLSGHFRPTLTEAEKKLAEIEGWILGVG
ncbi:MAG: hypothetical protein IH995_01575 [Proteobacteria bacterium]|nr:hypothetical protein [Pseudomonadota bacterium]